MGIYSFKTDGKFDEKIEEILSEIPRGSRSAFIKDALMNYIYQAEAGIVSSRYVQRATTNTQSIGAVHYSQNNMYSQQNVNNSYSMPEIATEDKMVEPPSYVEEQEYELEDDEPELEIEGYDENLSIC